MSSFIFIVASHFLWSFLVLCYCFRGLILLESSEIYSLPRVEFCLEVVAFHFCLAGVACLL